MLSRLRSLQGPARLGVLACIVIAAGGVVAGCDVSENADLERGRQLFISNCGTCHALAEAGTSAEIAPDLDAAFAQSRADGMDNDTIEGVVEAQIANPREIEEGVPNYDDVFMPADIVTGQDAEDVSAYVGSVAGVPGAAPPPLGDAEQVFADKCGLCHTLSAAGTTGTSGPDLDQALTGKNAGYIRQQIVEPDSEITPGFSPGVMPQDFEEQLPPENLRELVRYLLDNAGR